MSAKTFEVTAQNFDTDVVNSEKPVLIDFWAEWCGPCRMIAPLVEQIADEFPEALKVGKLDTDAHQDLAMKFGIMSIPTLLLFKGGKPVARITGYQPKDRLLAQITPHLS
ncbi:MAG: thioredoxin [bacterium]|nr:thioredoxin [bacterium]